MTRTNLSPSSWLDQTTKLVFHLLDEEQRGLNNINTRSCTYVFNVGYFVSTTYKNHEDRMLGVVSFRKEGKYSRFSI